MTREHEVDLILNDCFFAFGQAVSTLERVDYDAIVWLRDRYRSKFLDTITKTANVWPDDRDRLMAVSRFLGQRAMQYADSVRGIDTHCVTRASAEVEEGCRMHAAELRDAQARLNQDEKSSAAVAADS